MGFNDIKKSPGKIGGADKVYIDGPSSTFGDLRTVTIQPQGQGDFVYGIQSDVFTTSSFAGATISTESGFCVLSSGTNAAGSATIQLRRGLKYRPGQGSLMRITALYSTPNAGNAQFVGCGTSECGYFLGYFGTSFGILHSITGQREIRKLTVTTGEDEENVTVTLDGNSIVVPVSGGNDPSQTAYQLARANYSQLGNGGWLADAVGDSVFYIAARSNSTSTGSYSVSGPNITGSFTRTKAGLEQTNNFISQSSFNLDRLDGTGPSGIILDQTKGNVFEIGFQYLGFGNCNFNIEDPETGKFRGFHIVKNANSRTTPVLKNPNVSVLATSANIGGTTSTQLKTASMSSFIEGDIIKLDPKFAKSFQFSSINTPTYVPLGILKVNRVFNDESCFGEFDILRIAGSNESTAKTLTIGFFLDPTIIGDVNFQYIDEENSIVSFANLDPSVNTIENIANLTPFYETIVGPNNSVQENLDLLEIIFGTGRDLVIAIKTSGSISGAVSVQWFEQQ
jgi:hypothetical protein